MPTMSPETVRDAMVPEPTTLAAEASAQELGRCFADNDDVRAIFVTEDGGGLLGVVTGETVGGGGGGARPRPGPPGPPADRRAAELPPRRRPRARRRLPLPRGPGSGTGARRRGGRPP